MKIPYVTSIGLLFVACLPTTASDDETLKASCAPLVGQSLKRICRGKITRDIKLRYKDQMTKINTAFAAFHSTAEPNRYFLTFYKSALLDCENLTYPQNQKILCSNGQTYQYNKSQIHCFNFNVQYVDELVELCLDQEDLLGKDFDKSAFAALHYTKVIRIGSTGGRTVKAPICWQTSLMSISTACAYLWWRYVYTQFCRT